MVVGEWVFRIKVIYPYTFLHFELHKYLLLYNHTQTAISQSRIADSAMKRQVLFLIVPFHPGVCVSKKPFILTS